MPQVYDTLVARAAPLQARFALGFDIRPVYQNVDVSQYVGPVGTYVFESES